MDEKENQTSNQRESEAPYQAESEDRELQKSSDEADEIQVDSTDREPSRVSGPKTQTRNSFKVKEPQEGGKEAPVDYEVNITTCAPGEAACYKGEINLTPAQQYWRSGIWTAAFRHKFLPCRYLKSSPHHLHGIPRLVPAVEVLIPITLRKLVTGRVRQVRVTRIVFNEFTSTSETEESFKKIDIEKGHPLGFTYVLEGAGNQTLNSRQDVVFVVVEVGGPLTLFFTIRAHCRH